MHGCYCDSPRSSPRPRKTHHTWTVRTEVPGLGQSQRGLYRFCYYFPSKTHSKAISLARVRTRRTTPFCPAFPLPMYPPIPLQSQAATAGNPDIHCCQRIRMKMHLNGTNLFHRIKLACRRFLLALTERDLPRRCICLSCLLDQKFSLEINEQFYTAEITYDTDMAKRAGRVHVSQLYARRRIAAEKG